MMKGLLNVYEEPFVDSQRHEGAGCECRNFSGLAPNSYLIKIATTGDFPFPVRRILSSME